jgi:hypothetical protein
MREQMLSWDAVDLEGVDRVLQVSGPFDHGRDVCWVGVQSLPQPFDPPELWPERFKFAEQAGQFL